jgi:hypothetical protein
MRVVVRLAIVVIALPMVLVPRLAGAQTTQPSRELVVGQGAFANQGGWVGYRGDSPDYERRAWARVPWPEYVATGGAVHPAMGDVDGDGLDEVVVGLGSGGAGWIAILDDASHGNALLAWIQVPWPNYNQLSGAVFPAVGDLDGDGRAEIVAGLGPGSIGWFAIIDDALNGYRLLAWRQVQWPDYVQRTDGRTHVAVGDLSGDGASEIIVGLGPGSNGFIEIFSDGLSSYQPRTWVQVKWPAYNAANGTVYPAAGDLDGDGRSEIVAGLGAGGAGWLEFFGDEPGGHAHRKWAQLQWAAYNAHSGESHPAVGNIDDDPDAEVIVGLASFPGVGGWFAILDDLNRGAAHVAWRNLEWPLFTAGGGATYPAAGHRHLITLLSPASGQQLRAGSASGVSWAADAAVATVEVEYSLDNGATWEAIGAPIGAAAHAASWTIPVVASRFVQLRVVDASTGRRLSPIRTFVILKDASALWQLVTADAEWTPRDGVGSFVFNDRIWQLGGWHWDVQTYPNVNRQIWSTTDGLDWRYDGLGPWGGTHVCGCVVFNNRMWIIGGAGVPDVWSSADGVQWTLALAQGPWGRRYKPYVVVHAGKIWLMGGFDLGDGSYRPFNDVWSSPDGITWTRVLEHAPWEARGAIHGEVVFDGKIWVIGGGQYWQPTDPYESYFNDVWSSTNGVDWTLVTKHAPWPARLHHNIAVYADRLWVFAGHHGIDRPGGVVRLLNDVWVSTDGVNWMELRGTPWSPRHAAATYSYRGDLHFMAGFLVNDVWKFHLAGNMEINDGAAATTNASVTLTLAPPDPSVAEMQFSNDGLSWSQPEAYGRIRTWTLAAGAGSKTVYVRFRRAGDAWTRTFEDGIMYNGT